MDIAQALTNTWHVDLPQKVAGHLWTIAPNIFRNPTPECAPFSTTVNDPVMGDVKLSGFFHELAAADTAVLIIHGFGGNARSRYCTLAVRAATAAGYASLRLSLRGADLSGEDIYHGGLTADLRAALASPEMSRFKNVFVVGYSVGGCIALRAAIERIDPRIRGVAAVCSPIDTAAGAFAFDDSSSDFYRNHVFSELNRVYEKTAARRPLPTPLEVVRRARYTRQRDEAAVVPRFGFANCTDYYEQISVSSRVHELDIPSLLVLSENDPVVPAWTVRGAIGRASKALSTKHVRGGGHLFFPVKLDLGFGGAVGLESQMMRWLSDHK